MLRRACKFFSLPFRTTDICKLRPKVITTFLRQEFPKIKHVFPDSSDDFAKSDYMTFLSQLFYTNKSRLDYDKVFEHCKKEVAGIISEMTSERFAKKYQSLTKANR
jgi:hypothetical protein